MYTLKIDICFSRPLKNLDILSIVFTYLVPLYLPLLVLTCSGDIEVNPGPASNQSESLSESYASLLNNGLSIMHINIQSLRSKLDILSVEAQPYDIIVLTETWLSNSVPNTDLSIPNFSPPYRCDRTDRIGGGVAVYVRDNLYARKRDDLSVNGLEAVWLELRIDQRSLIIGGIYRPPDSNNNHWLLLEESIDRAFSQRCENVIITGDFNIDMSNSSSNKMSRLISSYNATQLISSHTYFTEHSKSLIDLIFVRNNRHVISSFVSDPFVPDLVRFHCPVVAVLSFTKPVYKNFQRRIWLYEKGDYKTYNDKLRATDWTSIIDNTDTDHIADTITDTILQAASDSIPNRTVTIRPGDVPWMTSEIRKSIKKRNRLHQNAKRLKTGQAWADFRNARNSTTSLIRKTKLAHQQSIIDKMNSSSTTSKQWFKLSKKLTNQNKTNSIPTLVSNGIEATTDEDKADLLNSFFCNQSLLDDRNHDPPLTPHLTHSTLSEITITPQDVKDAIALIDPSKASGPDLISPRLLKAGVNELCIPLSKYFNKLLTCSTFPSAWKLANVSPIFKKSDPSLPSNYRPISLLSCIGKLMERCIHKYLYNYIIANDLLTSKQSGFIKGDSTVNQLTFLYNDISQAMDQGKEVRAVFCDISKAFDRVWHRGLISKLSSFGITGSLLHWFQSYLGSRKQRVVIANSSSQWSSVQAGVPQGSILGPLLFLIYINDIVKDIHANICLFADDTSLYIVVENPATSANILNNDLERINLWSKRWLVTFNPQKTESMIFSRKRIKPHHPNLLMNNTVIANVETHKHLGLILSDDAKWKAQITECLNKAWQRIGILRSLKFLLSRSCLERMYFSFIRPLLEYSDVVWDNCCTYLKNDIEAVQNEAARIVTGATKLCNINTLLSELSWLSLAERRKQHKLTLFFKMKSGLGPNYLSNLIPEHSDQSYNLRHIPDVPPIHANSQAYSSSFLPSTIHLWNALPDSTRNAVSVASFKHCLNKNKSKPNPLHNLGSRRDQILYARLRLGCSSLQHDLYRKNIIDSPLCVCGSPETTSHFFLQCPRYTVQRQTLLNTLPCIPTINNILFGNDQLSPVLSRQLYLDVQKYISSTKRFDD